MQLVPVMRSEGSTLLELEPCEPAGPSPRTPRERGRVFALTALVVVLGAVGNLCLGWGMKHLTTTMGWAPMPYIHAMLSPLVTLGVVLLILWLLTRMVLLSRSDLSFVLPATASGYVLNAIFALVFLKESLDKYQWAGTLLICLGAALVGSDPKGHNTSTRAVERRMFEDDAGW